jgi:hypothetical protein
MLDGKGLVYQKRAGTGAAAYSNPDFRVGANPLDVLANQVRVENKYKVAEAAQKKAANMKALDVDLNGWDYDNKRFFSEMENKLKQEGAALAMAGKDLNNYADKDVLEWQKKVDEGKKAALASANQGEMYKALVDLVNKDPEKYDRDQTMLASKQYMEMNPLERLKVDPQTLAVFRYDPYGPVEDLKIDDFGSKNEWKGLTSGGFRETLQTQKLKNEINSRVENPESMKFYNYNKDKYGWKDLKDYKEFLYQYKKNQFVADSKYEVIKPDNTYGWGYQDYYDNVKNSGGINIDIAQSQPKGTASDKLTQKILLNNAQGISGVNIVIPGIEARSLSKNEKGVGIAGTQGNYLLQNANLGIALVRADNGQLLPSYTGGKPTEWYKFKDKDGKEVKYTPKQAFEKGLIKFTPVLQGSGRYKTGPLSEQTEPISVEAEGFITKDMAQKTAAENDAYQKYLALKQLSEEYNRKAEFGY